MIRIALHFPWRRYHATPWGRFVNEGAVEIPPSPWRLLRALYATWKERCPDLPDDEVHPLLNLLSVPPTYLLPPYQLSHTRHYYPDHSHRTGTPGGTDLALDAFAVLGADATLYIQWPGTLDPGQAKTLARLVESLPYLGRADSTVEAHLMTDAEELPTTTHTRVIHLTDGDAPPPGWTSTEVLAPTIPLDIDALIQRPTDVRAKALLYPPGSCLLTYTSPQPQASTTPSVRRRALSPVTALRLTISAPALPPLTQAVPLADAFRATCIEALIAARKKRGSTPAVHSNLAGKTAKGRPLIGPTHGHIHFLPHDANGDRRIDELVLWIPGGLTPEEVDAIRCATTRTIGVSAKVPGPRNLHLRIAAQGSAEDVLPSTWRTPSTTFASFTPLVPNRHLKKHQTLLDFLTAEVTRELTYRNLPAPTDVSLTTGDWPLHTQHRWTKKQTRAHHRPSHGVRLTFDQPLQGPLALGHHSHFGLGLLLPDAASEPQVHTRHADRT